LIGSGLLFLLGLALSIVGAELLVRGASRIALALGISPLLVGLTIVAMGTSSPEIAVSIQAAVKGGDIALGNALGSNIFNVLMILGLSAAIVPLKVPHQLVKLDVPIMIGASLLVWLMALNGRLGFWEGILLLAGIVGYCSLSIQIARRERAAWRAETSDSVRAENPTNRSAGRILVNLVLAAVGLLLLILGADQMVNGAVAMARLLGISEMIIGLTIVAAGTSMPEVVTSVMASIRGEREIAVGNVVGSNIFNIFCVLGLAATVAPQPLQVPTSALLFDIPITFAVAVICLPIFLTGLEIRRWEGIALLVYYAAYLTSLLLLSGRHDHLAGYSWMVYLVILPSIGLALLSIVRYRANRHLSQVDA